MRTLSRCLLLGFATVLLQQGASAEPRFSFAATPGKLPKDVVPKHYVLRIEPLAGNERFAGRAEIDIEVAKPVDSITLNGSGLDLSSAVLSFKEGIQTLKTTTDSTNETVTLTPEKPIP